MGCEVMDRDIMGTEIEVESREEMIKLGEGIKVCVGKKRDIGFVK